MKTALLTCCVCGAFFNTSVAQVPKGLFLVRIHTLEVYIRQQNATQQRVAFMNVNTLMHSQITYLNSEITTVTASYSADTAKANTYPLGSTAQKNERIRANLLVMRIIGLKSNLTTDNTLLNEIIPLSANIYTNRTAILSYLNQFAATLQ